MPLFSELLNEAVQSSESIDAVPSPEANLACENLKSVNARPLSK
jgi:hypothetical protein